MTKSTIALLALFCLVGCTKYKDKLIEGDTLKTFTGGDTGHATVEVHDLTSEDIDASTHIYYFYNYNNTAWLAAPISGPGVTANIDLYSKIVTYSNVDPNQTFYWKIEYIQ